MEYWSQRKKINGKTVLFDSKFCTGVAYKKMWQNHPLPMCWGCGNNHYAPRWWYAPWLIERAHIVNKPRKKDRRSVILLCSECHKETHLKPFSEGQGLKPITMGNMIWLKKKFDPWFYDRNFLGKCHIGKLPKAVSVGEQRKSLIRIRCGALADISDGDRTLEIEIMLSS